MRAKKAKALKKAIYGDSVATRKGRQYFTTDNKHEATGAPLEAHEMAFRQRMIVADDKRRAYKSLKRTAA